MGGDDGEGIHPDITNTIAATLAGLASSGDAGQGHHHTSSPDGTDSSCESIHNNPINTEPIGSATNHHQQNNNQHNSSRYGNNTPTPGLDGILDWPTEEFMNPFFPAVSLDAAMFGGNTPTNNNNHNHNVNNASTTAGMMTGGAVRSTPAMMLTLPSPSPPQMSSLPPLVNSSHPDPTTTLADDVEELPSHLDTLSAIQLPSPLSTFCFDAGTNHNSSNGKQVQQQQQHMSIPADALLMATSPRMYAQPSVLYDTISRIFFQCKCFCLQILFHSFSSNNTDDQEFCILPLTCDFAANPFRYNMQAMQQSSLLRHCILALSYRHVDHDTGACTSEATAYKRRATQMLEDKIYTEAAGETQPDESLLDASIVLMTLDVSRLYVNLPLVCILLLTLDSAQHLLLAHGKTTFAVPSVLSKA